MKLFTKLLGRAGGNRGSFKLLANEQLKKLKTKSRLDSRVPGRGTSRSIRAMLLKAISLSLESMKRCEARGYRFMGEAIGFIEVCASNNDAQIDSTEKQTVV